MQKVSQTVRLIVLLVLVTTSCVAQAATFQNADKNGFLNHLIHKRQSGCNAAYGQHCNSNSDCCPSYYLGGVLHGRGDTNAVRCHNNICNCNGTGCDVYTGPGAPASSNCNTYGAHCTTNTDCCVNFYNNGILTGGGYCNTATHTCDCSGPSCDNGYTGPGGPGTNCNAPCSIYKQHCNMNPDCCSFYFYYGVLIGNGSYGTINGVYCNTHNHTCDTDGAADAYSGSGAPGAACVTSGK